MRWEHTDYPARIICPQPNITYQSLSGLQMPAKAHIINLPKIPENITPSNVNEKVRLYLLFS